MGHKKTRLNAQTGFKYFDFNHNIFSSLGCKYGYDGDVKCLETIKFSIMTHQGCWGECNFCAIGVHQGRTIRNRSEEK